MKPQSRDTSPEAETVLLDLLRKMTPNRKWNLISALNRTSRNLAISGIKHRFPQADEKEVTRRFAEINLGSDLAREVYGPISESLAP